MLNTGFQFHLSKAIYLFIHIIENLVKRKTYSQIKQDEYTMDPGQSSLSQQKVKKLVKNDF